jgi:hypothetical protein
VIGTIGLDGARGGAERGEAGHARIVQHLQALRDQCAVQAGERNDVADRAECDQVEQAQQVGLRPAVEQAAPAQLAVERDHEQEDDADRGQAAASAGLVEPVRVDHGQRRGQLGLGLVVVDHDDLEPRSGGFGHGRERGHARVDRDDQPAAACRQTGEHRRVRPVALGQAIGNLDGGGGADGVQIAGEQRAGCGAVDVEVAEDADRLAGRDRVGEPCDGAVHVEQVRRVRQHGAQARRQERLHLLQPYAAPGQHAAEDLRQPVTLADRGGEGRVGVSFAPGPAGERERDGASVARGHPAYTLKCGATGRLRER